jgi:RNA polymerase sigma-70 factor (ECF subfamily)
MVPNPEELTQRLEDRELLDRVLDKMPEELRAVFVLHELEELSVDEVARLLSLPRGTAATRLRRSREVFHGCARSVALEAGAVRP